MQPQPERDPNDIVPAGTIIDLPYNLDDAGKPIEIQLEQDVYGQDLQTILNKDFPRDLTVISNQLSTRGADPISKEEYDYLLSTFEDAKKDKPPENGKTLEFMKLAADVLPEVAKGLGMGIWELAVQSGKLAAGVAPTPEQKVNSFKAGLALIEGTLQGTETLIDTASILWQTVAGRAARDKGYAGYAALKDMEKLEMRREAGETIIPGNIPEVAAASKNLKNVLDLTLVIPPLKAARVGAKIGTDVAEVALKEMAQQMAKEATASLGNRAIGGLVEGTGKLIQAGADKAVDIVIGAAKNRGAALGAAGTIGAAGYLLDSEDAKAVGLLGAGALAGTTVLKHSGIGKALQMSGRVLGSEEAASKIVAEALKDGTLNRSISNRIIAQAVGADAPMRIAQQAFDGALLPAVIGGTNEATREYADPLSTPGSIATRFGVGVVAGGAAGGAIGGTFGGVGEITGAARARAFHAEAIRDIASRPESRSVYVGGEQVSVPNELSNRASLLMDEKMSVDDRQRVLNSLAGVESAGVDVVFVNNDTVLPESLGGSGQGMGAGVHMVNENGKKILFLNSDTASTADVLHEVTHAIVSDSQASTAFSEVVRQSGGIQEAVQTLVPFAETYIQAQEVNNPTAAGRMRESMDIANNPQATPEERMAAIQPIVHEYLAQGVAESLKGVNPDDIAVNRGGNVINRALFHARQKFAETFYSNRAGASVDPLTGHFWKDGKIISDPVLASTTSMVRSQLGTGVARRNLPPARQRGAVSRETPPPFPETPPPLPGATQAAPDAITVSPEIGQNIVSVRPRDVVRFEDVKVDGTPVTKNPELLPHLKHVFDQFQSVVGETIFTEDAGPLYAGNSNRMGGKSMVLRTEALAPAQIQGILDMTDHRGLPVIAPENQAAVKATIEAIPTGQFLAISSNSNVGGSKTNRKYTLNTVDIGFPWSLQGTDKSGPQVSMYDATLLVDILNFNKNQNPEIASTLKQFKIGTLEDVIPYLKTHLDNYANGEKPGAQALLEVAPAGTTPEQAGILRDLFNRSSKNARKGTVEANRPIRVSRPGEVLREVLVPEGAPAEVAALERGQSVFQSIRLDSITDAVPYTSNGQTLFASLDDAGKKALIPKMNRNFSPGSGRVVRERIGDKIIVTDNGSGQRIIVNANGRAELFSQGQGGRKFKDYDDAVYASNKELLSQAKKKQRRFYPEEVKENSVVSQEIKRLNGERKAAQREAAAMAQVEARNKLTAKEASAEAKAGRELIAEGDKKIFKTRQEGLARIAKLFDEVNTNRGSGRNERITQEQKRINNEQADALLERINAMAREPMPFNPERPPALPERTTIPNVVTAADDPHVPRAFIIKRVSAGKFAVVPFASNTASAVRATYAQAVKEAQEQNRKRR